MSCLVMSCLVISCLVMSCLVMSCLVMSCLVMSCLVMSCLVMSCLVISCLIRQLMFLRPSHGLFRIQGSAREGLHTFRTMDISCAITRHFMCHQMFEQTFAKNVEESSMCTCYDKIVNVCAKEDAMVINYDFPRTLFKSNRFTPFTLKGKCIYIYIYIHIYICQARKC